MERIDWGLKGLETVGMKIGYDMPQIITSSLYRLGRLTSFPSPINHGPPRMLNPWNRRMRVKRIPTVAVRYQPKWARAERRTWDHGRRILSVTKIYYRNYFCEVGRNLLSWLSLRSSPLPSVTGRFLHSFFSPLLTVATMEGESRRRGLTEERSERGRDGTSDGSWHPTYPHHCYPSQEASKPKEQKK